MPVLRSSVTPTRQLLPSPPLTPGSSWSSPSPPRRLPLARPGRLRSSRPRCANGHVRCTDPICVKYRDAPEAFLIPEIMESVLTQADFRTVMAISRVSQYGRSLAQRETRVRIRTVLVPFIGEDQFDGFMQALHTLGGGIIGSHVRRLLTLKSTLMDEAYDEDPDHGFLRSKNLNLVVNAGALDKAKDCLEALGYSDWCDPKVERPYRESIRSFAVGVKVVAEKEGEETVYKVSISESTGGLMQVVLASPNTCQTNILTPTRVYSVYPRLIARRSCLKSDNPHIRPFRRHDCCDLCEMSNRKWKACGVHCPCLQRKTVGDEGIASFVWNPNFAVPASRFNDTDYLLAESILSWRFAIWCRNVRCKNYAPPRRRFGLV